MIQKGPRFGVRRAMRSLLRINRGWTPTDLAGDQDRLVPSNVKSRRLRGCALGADWRGDLLGRFSHSVKTSLLNQDPSSIVFSLFL